MNYIPRNVYFFRNVKFPEPNTLIGENFLGTVSYIHCSGKDGGQKLMLWLDEIGYVIIFGVSVIRE